MRLVFKCEYCSYMNDKESVENHEKQCPYNPVVIEEKNKLSLIAGKCPYVKVCHSNMYYFYGCGLTARNKETGNFDYCVPTEACEKIQEKDSKRFRK